MRLQLGTAAEALEDEEGSLPEFGTGLRAPNGIGLGMTARTAFATSSGKRMRPSAEPPYASLRWLEIGDQKLCSR